MDTDPHTGSSAHADDMATTTSAQAPASATMLAGAASAQSRDAGFLASAGNLATLGGTIDLSVPNGFAMGAARDKRGPARVAGLPIVK
jgi:hypothetical protein